VSQSIIPVLTCWFGDTVNCRDISPCRYRLQLERVAKHTANVVGMVKPIE
jgi:hypothetical protein